MKHPWLIRRETLFQGLPAWLLGDDTMELTVVPALGGRIARIVDRRRQRDWLWQNPSLPYRLPQYGTAYDEGYDVGGFDDCFPSAGSCCYPQEPWQNVQLPEHGEVWALPWSARRVPDGLQLAVPGVFLPYRLEKSITLLGEGRFRLDYRASNLSNFPLAFVWSSHPQFNIRPGMMILLPTTRMRVQYAPAFPARAGEEIPWSWLPEHNLSLTTVMPPEARLAVKLVTPRLDDGWAALNDPRDDATFRFTFDPDLVPNVGLWLNYGCWAGVPGARPYYNLALQPAIGASAELSEAMVRHEAYGALPPRGRHEWWLEVTVS